MGVMEFPHAYTWLALVPVKKNRRLGGEPTLCRLSSQSSQDRMERQQVSEFLVLLPSSMRIDPRINRGAFMSRAMSAFSTMLL